MKHFVLQGELPRAALGLLAEAGWRPGPTGPLVVRTSRPVVPTGVTPGWVWVCAQAVPLNELRASVERGAIDAFAQTRGWEARLLARLRESLVAAPALPEVPHFVAHSVAAKALLRKLHQASQSAMPVLLTGETGTGKELASRLVHQWSARRAHTFVPINCAAIPDELMESELFGYVRGAFSGATRDYDGQIAAAEGGTVFLDEIDDTPTALQTKLLRLLEDKVVSRLGENQWRRIDFRLVAATNRDLKRLISQGQFGDDLYERVATVQIELPPLRDRLDDLPGIALQLVARFYAEDPAAAKRHQVAAVTDEALEVLRAYPWPGNIRELRNVVFGALVVKRTGDALLLSDLPTRLWRRASADQGKASDDPSIAARVAAGGMNLKAELERVERAALVAALRHTRGNAAEAARLLGSVGRGAAKDPGGTVRTMMKRLGISASWNSEAGSQRRNATAP
jgi:DNA-binding NtrC family response regulator